MIIDNLFITITNANFDFKAIEKRVKDTLVAREELKERVQAKGGNQLDQILKDAQLGQLQLVRK